MDAEGPALTTTDATAWVTATRAALEPLANPERAASMSAYMKDIAPFLGITALERRSALRRAWTPLGDIDERTVGAVATALWGLPEREYQYAGCDLIARRSRRLSSGFLAEPVETLLTTKSWWDTVDSLGTAAVTGIVQRDPAQVDLMWRWLEAEDRWLVRAALQHQRGRRADTDIPLLLAMCDRRAADREFFIAKAVGWALRDAARWDPEGVRGFLAAHADLSGVARREAERGLRAAG